jgi:hypothetical protein
MLFLRKLARLEVLRDGSRELMLERVVDGDSLIVSDGEDDRVWHLLRGDFNHPADELRRRYPAKITQGADITFRPDVNVSIATGNGRFSAVDQWPVLGVHRGMSTASRSHFLLRAIAWAYLGPAIALGGLAVCVFGFGALAVAVRLVLVLFKQAGV